MTTKIDPEIEARDRVIASLQDELSEKRMRVASLQEALRHLGPGAPPAEVLLAANYFFAFLKGEPEPTAPRAH